MQEETSWQADFWLEAIILKAASVFSKKCFDEEIAWDYFYLSNTFRFNHLNIEF